GTVVPCLLMRPRRWRRETTVQLRQSAPTRRACLGFASTTGRRSIAMELRHLALAVRDEAASCRFYQKYFGFDTAPPQRMDDGVLVSDDLNHPAPVALAVKLDEEHTLPRAEQELALANRDRLARGAEQHRHAVGVTVPDVHVLRTDVLCPLVPIVVGVIGLDR